MSTKIDFHRNIQNRINLKIAINIILKEKWKKMTTDEIAMIKKKWFETIILNKII